MLAHPKRKRRVEDGARGGSELIPTHAQKARMNGAPGGRHGLRICAGTDAGRVGVGDLSSPILQSA